MNGANLDILSSLRDEERDRTALISDAGVWSFADVQRRTRALAVYFHGLGIQPLSRVALVASPAPEVYLAICALAAMRATLVPIHPRLSESERQPILDVARASHVLSPDQLAKAALNTDCSADSPGSVPAFCSPSPDDFDWPLAIVSTSGTSGQPKGAVLSRRAFVASAGASEQNLGWIDEDRWLLCLPVAHVGGLSIVTRTLLSRRTVVMLPRFDPRLVLDAIRKHRVTLLSVVPTMLHALMESDTDGTMALPRAILVGGAAATDALLDKCAERRIRVLTTYGLTEACSQVASQAPPKGPAHRLSGSGAPLPGFELRIVDDDEIPLPQGAVGRIQVRGPALFDGYLKATSEGLDPARTRDGFFDTGDLGEIDDRGQLHIRTRRTDLIVTGGENVYPAEVETSLARCPGVRRALVFGVRDDVWGQIVAAVIEADPEHLASQDAKNALLSRLADYVKQRLASHKRPRKLALVSALENNATGKLDRRNALERFARHLTAF